MKGRNRNHIQSTHYNVVVEKLLSGIFLNVQWMEAVVNTVHTYQIIHYTS